MATSQNVPTYGSVKTIVDYERLLGRIIEDKHVIFNISQDLEALEILDLLRENGLEKYCSAHVDVVMQYKLMEFLRNLKAIHMKELESVVKGREILVSNADLIRTFDLPTRKIFPTLYRCDDDVIIRAQLFRDADKHASHNFVKPILKRKYMLLFEILLKSIMRYSFNPENITATKFHFLAALVDQALDINWARTFKAILLQEKAKFGIDAAQNLVLEKKINNLNKVSVILMDKIPDVH